MYSSPAAYGAPGMGVPAAYGAPGMGAPAAYGVPGMGVPAAYGAPGMGVPAAYGATAPGSYGPRADRGLLWPTGMFECLGWWGWGWVRGAAWVEVYTKGECECKF